MYKTVLSVPACETSLTSPESCDKYQIIIVFPNHDFSECVIGIFSLVMGDYVIHDSVILDILSYIIHKIPEFSLYNPLHVTRKICFRCVLCHDVSRVIFNPNILDAPCPAEND